MKARRYLEVTYRKGRPLAAYLRLAPKGQVSRSRRFPRGLVVDYAADDGVLGIEITAPTAVTIDAINEVLEQLGLAPVQVQDLAPLDAA